MDIVVQHCDTTGEFALMFVRYRGPQLLKHLTVTVWIDCDVV
jgi:hypothetical protein